MNEEKKEYGIKDTKEFLRFGFAAAKVVKQAKENDGKIDFNDAALLIQLTPLIGPAIDDIGNIINEAKDLDDKEVKELLDFLKVELGEVLNKEEFIAKLEAVYKWGIATADLIAAF